MSETPNNQPGFDTDQYIAMVFIFITVIISAIWSAFNAFAVLSIKVEEQPTAAGEGEAKLKERNIAALVDIGAKINAGANAFLKREYTYMIVFVAIFSVIVYFLVDIYG